MALTANQLVVGMMNMAAGGYNTLVSDYVTANGDIAAANALLQVAGLSAPALGGDLVSSNSFATTLVGRVLSGATSTVQADVATLVENYLTETGKTRGEVAVELITLTINAGASHPLLGVGSAAFVAKVAAADAYTGTSTTVSELAAVVGASSSVTSVNIQLTQLNESPVGGSASDSIYAVVGGTVGVQDQTTLNSGDSIDGGAGTDTMYVNMTGSYSGGALIRAIESLRLGTDAAAVTFNYNTNEGLTQISGVSKVVADMITTTEALTIANMMVPTGESLPTLSWENQAGSQAGTVNLTYRTSAVSGTSTNQGVELSNVNGMVAGDGVLNIGAGVETLTINSAGSGKNTLNNSANADTSTNAVAADLISTGALTKVVLTGSAEIGQAAGVVTDTTGARAAFIGETDRAVGADTGLTGDSVSNATESNLLSVGARVTEVDASAATGATNVRFMAKTDGSETNVTFKGGSGNDYVEFEVGNINATGGDGNDTFAFINTQYNSTLTTADSIVGGAGTDTIQMGVNGAGTYNLETTEFNNKSGIDVLDMRGAVNTVKIADGFVTGSDAGLSIRTDKIIQSSSTSSANPTGGANNALEDASVNTIDITSLAANRAISITGGSGSDRLLVNEVSLNSATVFDGGTNVGPANAAVAGDYDTLTVLNSAVLTRGDLTNIKGIEGIVLTENVTGNSAFEIELTEAFVTNNTASSNSSATDVDDRVLQIVTAAAANGNALGAADTVKVDVTDLFDSTTNTLKTSLVGRQIDTGAVGATVSYVYKGTTYTTVAALQAATNAAGGTFVSGADATGQASVAGSGANAAAATATATTALTAGGTFTGTAGTNDTFTGTIASLVGTTVTGTAADTETLTITDAGAVVIPATVTNIDVLNLSSTGANVVTGAIAAMSAAGTINGGTSTDQLTLVTGNNISGMTLNSIETINLVGANTLSIAQNNSTTNAFTAAGGADTVTLSAAGTVNAISGVEAYTLAAGAASTINASSIAQTLTVTGGLANTYNMGATLDAADTITGSAGADVMTVTGAAVGSANVTAIETIQVNYTTAATFTTGAMAPGVASTITAAGSTAAVTLDASLYNATTSLTIIDGAGNDIITVPAVAAERDLTTVTLSTGGSDKIVIANTAGPTTTNEVTINNFTTGITAAADTIDLKITNGATETTSYQVVTAAATNETATASVIEITAAVGTVTAFDAGAAGLVENLIATAIANSASGTSAYIIYGSGAMADKAALYEVVSAAAGAETTPANITVELVAVFNNVTADSFVTGNFV